jgi:WGR domain
MARFYAVSLQADLLGGWCVVREWGRIGLPGRVRVDRHGRSMTAQATAGQGVSVIGGCYSGAVRPAIGDPARSRVDVTPGGEPGRVGRDGVSEILADEHDVTQPCDMARE